jgi:hypothetical protein
MTLATMYGLVSQRLNEGASGPVFYPKSEMIAALNEAERFFVLLTLGLENTAPWTISANTTFFHMLTAFPDWIAPLRISNLDGSRVRPSRLEDLCSLNSGWIASPQIGNPQRYCVIGGDLLAIYGQPTVNTTVNVTYAQAPVPLVQDTDVPQSPAEYHPRLVDYGVYRMRQVEGGQEFQKGLPFFASFFEGAQHYAAYVRARNIGSRYDKVPFELERFDLSQLLKLRKDLLPGNKPAEV